MAESTTKQGDQGDLGDPADPADQLFVNGNILASYFSCPTDTNPIGQHATCMAVSPAGLITYIGTAPPPGHDNAWGPPPHDLGGRAVLPGFVDGHMHLLMLGRSLSKLDLSGCGSLAEIRAAIGDHARRHPELPRILCKGWMHTMTAEACKGGAVTSKMLDGLDIPSRDSRPIFIDSKDLHSCWCNDAALEEMGIADDTPDPAGGTIHRYPANAATSVDGGAPGTPGKATGLLEEAAVLTIVWPHLAAVATRSESEAAVRAVVAVYSAAGYTGAVDMAMDGPAWEALQAVLATQQEEGGSLLPIRISAYWLVTPCATVEEDLVQVRLAAAMKEASASGTTVSTAGSARVVGIKIILDGVVDACTAAISKPHYTTGSPAPPPLWTFERLDPVVRLADELGLQVALHAIGDAAVSLAVSALRGIIKGTDGGGDDRGRLGSGNIKDRRHRIEHLELTSPSDAAALAELGITASIQPVHADPAILTAWPKLLGGFEHPRSLSSAPSAISRAEGDIGGASCTRAFAYRDLALAGAQLALGTDSPTAPWSPFGNAFVATTRRSARRDGAAVAWEEVRGLELTPPQQLPMGVDRHGVAIDDKRDLGYGYRLNPDQTLALGTTLHAASWGAAYSVFDESRVGSLEVGKRADFVVLGVGDDSRLDGGQDEADKLLRIRVDETWFAGRRVWKQGVVPD